MENKNTPPQENNNDLLSALDKIQIEGDDKITTEDREYCEGLQRQCYEVLDHLKTWYDLFHAEAEKFQDTYNLDFEPNGRVEVNPKADAPKTLHNPFGGYRFTPFELVNEIARDHGRTCILFSNLIIDYFQEKYKFHITRPDATSYDIPIDFRPVYTTCVNHIISHLEGKSFREKAEEEIISQMLNTVRDRSRSTHPQVKGAIITLPGVFYLDKSNCGQNNCDLSRGVTTLIGNICTGLALYATDRIDGGLDFIPHFDPYSVRMGQWYLLENDKISAVRFYMNGRIDVRCSSDQTARECYNFLRLYSLVE